MNDSRKELTLEGVEEAIAQIEEKQLCQDDVLVVYLPDVHESLAGIIAGRIREKYNKPSFVLTRAEEGVKGSGRSIDAFHMYDEMTKCKQLLPSMVDISWQRESPCRKRMWKNFADSLTRTAI